jgi:phosphatidate cytidylyltransferase
MKTRIITAAVAIPLLLLVLMVADKIVAAVVWGLMLAVAAYELLYGTGLIGEPRLIIYSCCMAFAVTVWSYFGAVHAFFLLLVMVFVVLLYAEMMISHVRITFDKIGMCAMGGLVIPFLLSSVIRILAMKVGRYVILIPFVVAFASDSGAYFCGMMFGRHKLSPVISQHKTIEGAVGGVFTAVLAMVIYAVVLHFNNFQVNFVNAMLYGILGSAAGVFGDLCFSVVKRQTGIKDYGNIIPGHGGILDRFDSMTVIAPITEVLLIILPVAVR